MAPWPTPWIRHWSLRQLSFLFNNPNLWVKGISNVENFDINIATRWSQRWKLKQNCVTWIRENPLLGLVFSHTLPAMQWHGPVEKALQWRSVIFTGLRDQRNTSAVDADMWNCSSVLFSRKYANKMHFATIGATLYVTVVKVATTFSRANGSHLFFVGKVAHQLLHIM